MDQESFVEEDSRSLRQVIEEFIQDERLRPKLEKKDKEIAKKEGENDLGGLEELKAERRSLVEEHSREKWLENAAKRSGQLVIVSHALKYLNPDAKGTNIYWESEDDEVRKCWIGTHCLGRNRTDDVVGNAAALDIAKFLSLEYRGKTLLQHVQEESPELVSALADDSALSIEWIKSFAGITSSRGGPSSHCLAKQVYFPVDKEKYHLLAPLFPTSLVHEIHGRFREASFSEETKAAREARKKGQFHDSGYVDYSDIAVQTFGGTKPQNVSQLNSERHGEAWLMPSFPPNWTRRSQRPPIGTETVFSRKFGGRTAVREQCRALADFLFKTDYNNVHIRKTRARMVERLVDEMILFAEEIHSLEPGWSTSPDCRLVHCERLWLDPGRATHDEEFAHERSTSAWRNEVAERFANWLNSQLRYFSKGKKELQLGKEEAAAWRKEAQQTLSLLDEEQTDA